MNTNREYESLPCIFPARRGEAEKIEARLMRVLREHATFEYECRDWYLRGDGRPVAEGGRGWSFPVQCVHGANAHTDYDNICGPCEGGYGYWNYGRELEDADRDLQWARSEYRRRLGLAAPLIAAAGAKAFSIDTINEIMDWTIDPVENFR